MIKMISWITQVIASVRYQGPRDDRDAVRALKDAQYFLDLNKRGNVANVTGAHQKEIRSADVVHMTKFPDLTSLTMSGAPLTNEHLRIIGRIASLETLLIGYDDSVTDEGLKELQSLRNLRTLAIRETLVSDAGLAHLKALTGLRSLTLSGPLLTASGIDDLRKALPNCKVDFR